MTKQSVLMMAGIWKHDSDDDDDLAVETDCGDAEWMLAEETIDGV